MTTTAQAPSEICEAEPAVMVPSLLNAGRSLPSDSTVVSARTPSSAVTWMSPPRAFTVTGHDLVVEDAVLPGLGGPLVGAGGERVLLLAGQVCRRRALHSSVSMPIACAVAWSHSAS